MKIYVITSGEYSYYSIDAVATDYDDAIRKLAIAAVDAYGVARIEEWDTEKGNLNGYSDNRYDVEWTKGECEVSKSNYSTIRVEYYCGIDGPYDLNIYGIRAENEQHALKIASEIKAQYYAAKAGIC